MTVGVAMMTQLTATPSLRSLFFWMFVTGLGIGPTLAVFTIIVQNAVPFSEARRGDLEPHLLPPDRRLGRAGDRRHAVRLVARPADPAQVGPVFAEIKATVPPAFQGQFDQLGQAAANGGGGLEILASSPASARASARRSPSSPRPAGGPRRRPGACGVHAVHRPTRSRVLPGVQPGDLVRRSSSASSPGSARSSPRRS